MKHVFSEDGEDDFIMDNGKWIYNFGDEEYWNCCDERFNTRKEAIKEGEIAALESGYDKFQVGQIKHFIPEISLFSVIEEIQQDAYDKCGEAADGYLDDISDKDETELEEMLNDTLATWLAKTKNNPSFYSVVDINHHSINTD